MHISYSELGAGAGIEAEVTGIGEIKVVHSSQIESVGQTSVESEVGLEEVGASEIMLVGDLASPAETATYPRLTTQSNTHNFRNSDFWMYSTNRFNLTKVQLTYDLPRSLFRGTVINNLSVYAYATNLLTISKERETLELTTGAAPQNRFYNIGFKIGF